LDELDLEPELTQARQLTEAVRTMLSAVGEDPDREGLRQTPHRVAKAWLGELFSGYHEDPVEYMTDFDSESYDQLIIVRDIPFRSHCEHHIMEFFGSVSVGYIPNQRVVGLSKIPRLVRTFSRRLQVQERMTMQIADALEYHPPNDRQPRNLLPGPGGGSLGEEVGRGV
jgi:GTP cyclohydrolase I